MDTKDSRKLDAAPTQLQPQEQPLDAPIHTTDAEFETVIKQHAHVVVDFWAEWCAPCRAIAPMIEDLAKKYAGKMTFVKLNTDENPRVPQQYMIMGIPTLLFFKDGKLVDQVVGAMPRGPFEERVKKHLA
jgi:thioredoxin 1